MSNPLRFPSSDGTTSYLGRLARETQRLLETSVARATAAVRAI